MGRFNEGMIFTNDNCIGCSKCISVCPVSGANIFTFKDGKGRVEVSEKKCIHCGKCLSVCLHNARGYKDDTMQFFDDLAKEKSISLVVSQAFYLYYREKSGKILGYLRSLGAHLIYDEGFGTEIMLWYILNYYDKHKNEKYIGPMCPVILKYAEYQMPELLNLIIPVHTPAVCTSIYANKYLLDEHDMAYLSPCVSMKDEMESFGAKCNIKYNVTLKHLSEYLKNVDLDDYDDVSDLKAENVGRMTGIPAAFPEFLRDYTDRKEILFSYQTFSTNLLKLIASYSTYGFGSLNPYFVEVFSCNGGCINGTSVNKEQCLPITSTQEYRIIREEVYSDFDASVSPEERKEELYSRFAVLDMEDFTREKTDRYRQQHVVPEATYEEIFNEMYKDTPQKRHIDCGLCGYSSCTKMVESIALGYSKIENCTYYANEEIKRQFYIDQLTRLKNRTGFSKDCEEIFKNNPDKEYCICICDINRYKIINDLFGFEKGDEIRNLLVRFVKNIADADGICGYFGSGTFVLCFENNDDLEKKLNIGGYFDCSNLGIDFKVTVRFGVYLYKDRNVTLQEALNFASYAMERINSRTRNELMIYTDEMKSELMMEADLTSNMHDALKTGEFVLYFQAQYDANTQQMTGCESLCRWIRKNAVVSPGLFIPLFEKNGFIRELDKYVWERAFFTVEKWLREGKKIVPVSVNISRKSLVDDSIIHTITLLKSKYSVPTQYIHFEVTESAYATNQEELIARVNKIRDLGFKIAMDDFGSGYSSFNSLKDIPIDILKLDMGFLRKNSNAERGRLIIKSVIDLAHSLGLTTVAEGVETEEQADYLREFGCDIIQGYLYAKPLPEDEYEKKFEQ